MINCVLIKYGEIFIRGKNKGKFFKTLTSQIKGRLKTIEDANVLVKEGRILVFTSNYKLVIEKLKYISGIVSFSPCICITDKSIENLRAVCLAYFKNKYLEQCSFKVFATRSDKKYPLNSHEIAWDIGGYILNNTENLTVDVHNPNVVLKIEVRDNIYMYSENIKGVGGLPYGTSGKGLLLLSGGIDSPVAGFLMAKRGVEIEAIYFHSPPYTSESALLKVKDLAEKLAEHTGALKLHVVNFTEIQLYLNKNVRGDKITLLLKRTMLKISEKLSNQINSKALIVGDSIGQVASQTINSLYVIDNAVSTPILRPLVATDKDDIIKLARQIETYDISIRPFEDCCTIFVPKHPDLKPTKKLVDYIDNNLIEMDKLIEDALLNISVFIF